jgi:hypothetical protein
MNEIDRVCLAVLAGGLLLGAVASVVFYTLVVFLKF